jgi:flagellar protein FliO/FliZ
VIGSRKYATLGFALCSAGSVAQPDVSLEPLVEPVLSTTNLLETAAGLALVLLLILGLAWLVRRFGRFPGLAHGAVRVIGGVSLGPREKAILLSVQGMRLLIGVAPGNIRTLYVIGEETRQAEVDASASTVFSKTLQGVKAPAGES